MINSISSKHQKSKQELNNFLKILLGPVICEALDDDRITEIMVNPDQKIWLENQGKICFAGYLPVSDSKNFLFKLAEIHNTYLTIKTPILEGTLPFNNERIEATIPPLTINPAFTIRKPPKFIFTLDNYIEREILTESQVYFIRECVKNRKNILVSGGPGTGKTTLTNAIIAEIKKYDSEQQRILILEDVNEIQCVMPNVYSMLTSPEVDMCGLLRIAMRSRPDRILVGEVRDKAALDLLKAWNTGCPGGIATIHANSAQASILRIISLAQEASVPPPNSLVAESVDVVINIALNKKHLAGRCVREVGHVQQDLSISLI